VTHAYNASYTGGIGRIVVPGQLGKKCETLSEKQLKQKELVCAQVVEHWISKPKALSSNPNTANKRKQNYHIDPAIPLISNYLKEMETETVHGTTVTLFTKAKRRK
jgi:hypothetical protein